ncbi:Uncharacterized conserved protein, contains HEPN domain [Dyadobacter soli]|uniref:Uncharacterized conserved protein, contains HEPN domain n=1 Tax=Dyadobacter soli TaxID=659014 RepID=A0A1G7XN41_9BACT|nr:DUF86 domain-containing protein [Dyadobacter soli]SDG85531.1 Uncharacterized conserved protein, contains HEPN domain [Dyadobacter soli]
MSSRKPSLLVQDILDSGNKILSYTHGQSFDEFANDDKTIDAVIRNFEIIGEAAARLPEDFKDQHSSIDWHKMRGFRNRIVHDYFGIDLVIVWEIRNQYLPTLMCELNSLEF